MKRTGSGAKWHRGGLALAAAVLAGCGSTQQPPPDPGPGADTMSMAEMRLDEAGGPSKAATPAGLVSPVASPDQAPPSSQGLTDAGANTPLGKQWIFVSVAGYDAELPGPPKPPSILMSRESGRVVGSTSCNPLAAAFEISIASGTLHFRNIRTGSAMCSSVAADAEDAVVDAMAKTDAFRLDGNRLMLLSRGSEVAELTTP